MPLRVWERRSCACPLQVVVTRSIGVGAWASLWWFGQGHQGSRIEERSVVGSVACRFSHGASQSSSRSANWLTG